MPALMGPAMERTMGFAVGRWAVSRLETPSVPPVLANDVGCVDLEILDGNGCVDL